VVFSNFDSRFSILDQALPRHWLIGAAAPNRKSRIENRKSTYLVIRESRRTSNTAATARPHASPPQTPTAPNGPRTPRK
jgi:hypothetical protein